MGDVRSDPVPLEGPGAQMVQFGGMGLAALWVGPAASRQVRGGWGLCAATLLLLLLLWTRVTARVRAGHRPTLVLRGVWCRATASPRARSLSLPQQGGEAAPQLRFVAQVEGERLCSEWCSGAASPPCYGSENHRA